MTQGPDNGGLFVGVNEPADPQNLSDLEKKHLPVLSAPAQVRKGEVFDVEIEVGKLLAHPNEHKHFIQFIELHADDTFLGRVDLVSEKTEPCLRLRVTLRFAPKELRAYQHCNLHGTWVGRQAIRVAD